MYSIFSYTPNRVNRQYENNVTARKPGLSTKKPFAERKIDGYVDQPSIIKSKQAQALKQPEVVSNDIMDFYVCSYRDMPENYSDINGPEENDNISSFLFGTMHKTPPPQRKFSEPDFAENKENSFAENYYDSILNKIRSTNVLHNGLDMFNDAAMPVLDLDEI